MDAPRPDDHPDPDIELVEPPPTVCDSCGSDDDALLRVRRIYVDPAAPAAEANRIVDEDEWWCLPCRTHYPHQVQPA